MTEYGEERERRRRGSMFLSGGAALTMMASVSVRTGPLIPGVATAGALLLIYVVGAEMSWRGRRWEAKRRTAGLPPSWSAQFPLVFGQQAGAAGGRYSRRRTGVGEYLGRLVYAQRELRWEPSPRSAKTFAR